MSVSVQILEGPLPPRDVPRAGGAGAVLCFEGVVRPTENGRPIIALDYEAYEPMASRELQRLAEQAAENVGLLWIEVEHSRGRVPVGACSFRLVVAAEHRKPAIAAMDWFIDKLKEDVPIWKRPVT